MAGLDGRFNSEALASWLVRQRLKPDRRLKDFHIVSRLLSLSLSLILHSLSLSVSI